MTTFPIIEKLGGEEAVLKVIEDRRRRRLTPYAIRSWLAERKIPAINILPLLEECAERGIDADVSDCALPARNTQAA